MKQYNEVSLPSRIIVEIYGFVTAAALLLIFESARFTCRFEIDGEENLKQNPHAIWAAWHEFVICSFVALPRLKKFSSHQVWLNHPAWSMRPIHRVMGYYGVDVVMGATGVRGREATEEILRRVRGGETTAINPDGPAGPKHQLKKGVLVLARESKLPVLAFYYDVDNYWTWPGWDQKLVPFPFAKIKVRISEPIYINAAPEDEINNKKRIEKLLS